MSRGGDFDILRLPVSLRAIDQNTWRVSTSRSASGDARPMFFFDSDGSRAGALWYIRRVTVDRVDPQIARREAEDLGLVDRTAWLAATDYVEKLEAAKALPGPLDRARPVSETCRRPHPRTGPDGQGRTRPGRIANADDAPMTLQDFLDATAGRRSDPAPRPTNASTPGRNAEERKRSDSAPSPPSETMVWRPFAAMILTGLSIPLVYWTRTIVPDLLSKARASLPAPAQQPRSIPHESGA